MLLGIENLTASNTNYLDKIKKLSKISIKASCDELKINRSNLLNGRTSRENEKRVYENIIFKYETIKKEKQ